MEVFSADVLFPLRVGAAIADQPPATALRPWPISANWIWTDRFTFRLSATGPFNCKVSLRPVNFIFRLASFGVVGTGSFKCNAFPAKFGNAPAMAAAGALKVNATVPA